MTTKPILLVEDDGALREALVATLDLGGYQVVEAADATQALRSLQKQAFGLVLTDVQMPGMDGHQLLQQIKQTNPEVPVILMTAYAQIDRAVAAMRNGASSYLAKPFEPDRLLAEIARYMLPAALEGASNNALLGNSPAMQQILRLANKVAATTATVLLTGESGVGKEVVARYIHQHSPRSQGPFVALNCAAIPESLLEATLFGHEKGAFTGAQSARAGKFEQAHAGTILLDEITEMPLELQPKLLRVLQEREVERVGGGVSKSVDVRVIATSNRDLPTEVKAGRFREDLYYRLAVFPLNIPPLRERGEDILLLALHFLENLNQSSEPRKILTQEAQEFLLRYSWPGNVRELENVIQRAAILAVGNEINPESLLLPTSELTPAKSKQTNKLIEESTLHKCSKQPIERVNDAIPSDLKSLEREHILATLLACQGSRRLAAQKLAMPERTLRHKLKQYREEGWIEEPAKHF